MSDAPEDNVVALRPPTKDDAIAAPEDGVVANLVTFAENLDRGLKLMIEVVAGLEKRVRALELAQRRADAAKPKPVILDARGHKAN